MRSITCTSCDRTSYSSSSSWKCNDDPSLGNHTIQLDISGYPHIFLRQGSAIISRVGPWNGIWFSGMPTVGAKEIFTYQFVLNEKDIYYKYELTNSSVLNEDNNEARRASRALLHGLSEPEIGNSMCLSRWISVIIMHDVGCMVVVTLTKPLAVGA